MAEKQAEKTHTEREDQVRLKPFLGLRPGVYLAVIYSIILLVILCAVLLYPGLARPGSVVMLQTEPAGAALRVDGVYMGTSPDRVFVPKGKHSLELVMPGFTTERIECEIPGRLFASALFPRRYPLAVTLHTPDPAAAFAHAAADYAAWTFGGEPTAVWQVPLSLSEGAYRAGFAAAGGNSGGAGSGALAELIRASARFAVTRAALRDLVRAKLIADNGGLSPSPVSLVQSAADSIRFLSENPGSAAWLAETLPPESAALVTASAWYQKQPAALAVIHAAESLAPPPDAAPPERNAPPARRLNLGGLSFTGLAGGVLVAGEPFPRAVPIAPFMLGTTEVPAAVFAEFLDANPRWRAERREALVSEGLATNDYLAGDGGPGQSGVSAVSWFAAEAFCRWLNGRLPPAMAAYEVRLPTEAEWEYAALSVKQWAASGNAEAAGIKNMTDNGAASGAWEWCADPYAPLGFFNAAPEAVAAIASPERAVRGGSALNPAGSVTAETRASLPPAVCSPFVSFRAVIAPKD